MGWGKIGKNHENEENETCPISNAKRKRKKNLSAVATVHVAVHPPSPSHVAQIKAHSSRNPKYPRSDSLSKEKRGKKNMP